MMLVTAVPGQLTAPSATLGRMRPLRLLLDGFGTYRNETDIDFTGVDFFALTGPTGAGKSTVIDALCFALYGTVPRWDNEREVRNALAPSANACRVSLVFELAGERYVAVRSLQRGRQGQVTTKAARLERLDPGIPADAPLAELLEASIEPLAEGPDNLRAAAQELLGLSYEHFTQSVLLPQGGFSEFLRATPANRQKLLVELLAFGVYKEIGQRARTRADHADIERGAAQRARDQLTDATEEAESAAAARLAALTGLVAEVENRLATLTELHNQTAAATEQVNQNRNVAAQLSAVRSPAEVPGLAQQIAAAETLVTTSRERRDRAASAAAEADRARGALPDKAATQRQLDSHELRRSLIAEAEQQAGALVACQKREEELAVQLQAGSDNVAAAQDAVEAAQRAHAAAGLAETLHVGEDCPVCRQKIVTLPPHEPPADLDSARARLAVASTAHRQAQKAHQEAAKATASAAASLEGTRRRLDRAAEVMADTPQEAELTASLAGIVAADRTAAAARDAANSRQVELAGAENARADLADAEQHAWAALSDARDKLVALGAPSVATGSGQDLAAAWELLSGWAVAEAERRTAALVHLAEAAGGLQRQFDAAAAGLAGLLAEHDVSADPLTRAPAAVADQRARTQAELERISEQRREAARLDKQIAAHREDAQVASMLGNLLRANSFERWLCSEALDSLVREASATLMELSGSQYELDRDDRNDLVVIDYSDAGARRPVHTLSGGETFQASLALALALSKQVIGLSAGMRELNSMFLDEGFGTLDSDTLETVASTLERLSADSDRMVGVITHVAELAERVPVRFVVSRSGTTSTIVREQS
jgi:DNA repair protein SbcC/Rad50